MHCVGLVQVVKIFSPAAFKHIILHFSAAGNKILIVYLCCRRVKYHFTLVYSAAGRENSWPYALLYRGVYIDFGAPQARNFWLFTLNCRLNCRTSTIPTHCYKCSTIPQVLQFFKLKFKNVLQFSLKVLQFCKFSPKAMFYDFLVFYRKFYDT